MKAAYFSLPRTGTSPIPGILKLQDGLGLLDTGAEPPSWQEAEKEASRSQAR